MSYKKLAQFGMFHRTKSNSSNEESDIDALRKETLIQKDEIEHLKKENERLNKELERLKNAKVVYDELMRLDKLPPGECTLLQSALWNGNHECIQIMVDYKAETLAQSADLCTALHFASGGNCSKWIKPFVEMGLDVDCPDQDGGTPLHWAAAEDSLEAAEVLINDVGANIDALNSRHEVPLHYACRFGAIKVAELLVEKGSRIDLRNNEGKVPYDVALVNYKGRADENGQRKLKNDLFNLFTSRNKCVQGNKQPAAE